MKTYAILFGLALAAVSNFSFAQTAGANATTDVQTSSGAVAATNGNQQNIAFNSPGNVKYSGTYTARVAPSMVAGGFAAGFSGNNCANTTQGGLSIPGGGVGFGKAVESPSCNHRQNGIMHSQQAASWQQMGYPEKAVADMLMADYEFCMADAEASDRGAEACDSLKLWSMSKDH